MNDGAVVARAAARYLPEAARRAAAGTSYPLTASAGGSLVSLEGCCPLGEVVRHLVGQRVYGGAPRHSEMVAFLIEMGHIDPDDAVNANGAAVAFFDFVSAWDTGEMTVEQMKEGFS